MKSLAWLENFYRLSLALSIGWVITASLLTTSSLAEEPKSIPFYIGTYTARTSEGVYRSELDLATGKMATPQLVAKLSNPSFLNIHPSGKYLYAVTENMRDKNGKGAEVVAYKIDSAGTLTKINSQSAEGDIPCYVGFDKDGKYTMIANYGNGSSVLLPIANSGGLLPASSVIQHQGSSVDKQRQMGPHAHSIQTDPSGRWIVAADLGTDQVFVYQLKSASGQLVPAPTPFVTLPPGAGPRHLDFSPDGKWAIINHEMTSEVSLAAWDSEKGVFTIKDSKSTLPTDHKEPGNSTAEALFGPDGNYAYVSNRGHNSIAIFRVDRAAGKLVPVGHESTRGKIPRNFRFDPTGKFLLAENQDSDSIHSFRLNRETGKLEATGESITVGMPVCIRFMKP
jgi:6-phosphogluconolactonase